MPDMLLSQSGRAKAMRLSDLPEDAWVIFSGGSQPNEADLTEFWQSVAWLWRCVDIRAAKIAACKFAIKRGEEVVYESDQEEEPAAELTWLNDLPLLLAKVEAATCLTGRAYWAKVGIGRVKSLAWLVPSTVTPVWDEETGRLLHYERNLPTESAARLLKVDEVIAFWPPDWTVETGPAMHTPGQAALNAAGVLANMDSFLAAYFDRGAVKVTLLTYGGIMKRGDAEELKTWWKKVASGVKNAFAAHVVNANMVTPVVIGEGVKDLENSTLTAEKREDICTALGVPQSKVTANAANYATKQGDDESFITDTIITELRWIQAALNAQLFEPLGLRLTFRPEEYSEMQADENERAASFASYVAAGLPRLLVADTLGIYIPEEYRRQMEEEEQLALEQRRKLLEISPTGNPADAPDLDDEEEDDEPPRPPAARFYALAKVLDEAARLERWLGKDPARDPADFKTALLTEADKAAISRRVRDKVDDNNWRPREPERLEALDDPTIDELADPEDLRRLIRQVERWARAEGVDLDKLINAMPIEEAMKE